MNILRYREQLLEWVARINERMNKEAISGVCVGVREGHIIKKLRDKRGVWLCANYPDFVYDNAEDASRSRYGILLYLVEKVPSGSQTDEEEMMHYAKMEELMDCLLYELNYFNWGCMDLRVEQQMNVEWEYDTFGGWNGLSVSFKAEEGNA